MKFRYLSAIGAFLLAVLTCGCMGSAPKPGEEGADMPPAAAAVPQAVNTQPAEDESGQEDSVSTAMYVPFGKSSYVMVDQKSGSVFTVRFPEEIYGLTGERITQAELQKGNILEITGNGIMMESYPGQYPGVSRIQVVSEGDPSDADVYQQLVDELYSEPDPSEPPGLNVEYTTSMAAVSAMADRGGYEWSFPADGSGERQSVIACGAHVLQWKEMNDLALEEPTELTLRFYPEEPQEVFVTRWPVQMRGTEGDIPDGEAVAVSQEDEKWVLKDVPAGYVYLVSGKWEQGTAEYGFMTR